MLQISPTGIICSVALNSFYPKELQSQTGSVVSFNGKMFASFVIKFPHSSVRVKVTVSAPVAPQSSLNPMLLFVTVAVPTKHQKPEKLVSHAANSPLGSFVSVALKPFLSEGAYSPDRISSYLQW